MGSDHLWDAIGAIGQVLGSLAVFVTLGYLAVQVRHARLQAQRALGQARSEALRDSLAPLCDERICAIQTKAQTALGGVAAVPTLASFAKSMEQAGVTGEEATVLGVLQIMIWNYRIQIIPYADELSHIERTQFDKPIRSAYGSPGIGRIFYESYIKSTAHPEAVRYVEKVLAQPG